MRSSGSAWCFAVFLLSLAALTCRRNEPAAPPATAEQAATQIRKLNDQGDRGRKSGDFAKSLDNYRQALAIARQFDLKESALTASRNVGDAFAQRARFNNRRTFKDTVDMDSAEVYLRQALGTSRELNDHVHEAAALRALGDFYAAQRYAPRSGEILVSQALRVSEEAGDTQGMAHALYQRGLLRDQRQDSTGAQQDYLGALRRYEELGDSQSAAQVERHIRH